MGKDSEVDGDNLQVLTKQLSSIWVLSSDKLIPSKLGKQRLSIFKRSDVSRMLSKLVCLSIQKAC